MENIVIYGAGGSGRELYCVLKEINSIKPTWNILGFIDDGLKPGTRNEYGKVLGGKEFLQNYKGNLAVSIAIGNPQVIKMIVDSINNEEISYPNIIAPTVILLDKESLVLGKGNVILGAAFISCNVNLGDFNFLDYCVMGHDSKLGSHNVILPHVDLCGGVEVGDKNFFGIKSTVLQYLKVGNNTKIAAGSIVMRNTDDDSLYIGNPAIKSKFGVKK